MTKMNIPSVHRIAEVKEIDFLQLKKNLKKDFSSLKAIKLAVLGDSSTQFLTQALIGYGYEYNIHLEIFEADYDQIERQIFDPTSEFYQFKPEFVLLLKSTQKLQKLFYKKSRTDKDNFACNYLSDLVQLYETVTSNLSVKVVLLNFQDENDFVFGHFGLKVRSSFIFQVRKLNLLLMELALDKKNLFLLDSTSLISFYGKDFCFDSKMYITGDIVFSLNFLPIIAKNILDIILAVKGSIKKCIILDLDNTLWGGIIGDDGIENIQIGSLGIGKAFSEFQQWFLELKKRGILLAVCSKNTEALAKEPFEKHPEMVLHLDDFSIFVANWSNKTDNIKYIKNVLNIGFDSMVFLDDSPFEREMVRKEFPEIVVPELPGDPAEYLSYVKSLNLFETASFNEEDEKRTFQYQEEARRSVAQLSFTNEEEFLLSLRMQCHVDGFNKFNAPRVAQLSQRSNQFNLRTIRYTEDDINKIAESEKYLAFAFSLKDKFGDYGLVSVLIIEIKNHSLFIDTFIMSCRVLKRNMEEFILNEICSKAKSLGFKTLTGEYIPTQKNIIVKDLYSSLGFSQKDDLWELEIDSYMPKSTTITKIE